MRKSTWRNMNLKTQVKAATYHMLKIEHNEGDWKAQVIFDV